MLKALSKGAAQERLHTLDCFHLARAIDLAWQGAGRTRTNPMVGAVVVKDGRVVGEGFHAAYGLDHAETAALDAAGESAENGTLYVTLEPCTHEGQTPPCTNRIVASGVKRVVVCSLDPDPRMDGKGVAQLRAAGIEVDVGGLIDEALLLNLPYFKRILRLGPAVTMKIATTMDGRIASHPGSRDAITGSLAQELVHRLRASRDAVLIGINTLLVDSPRLDCRRLDQVQLPVPAVLDSTLRFPDDYSWLGEGREPIVITGPDADTARAETISNAGGRVVCCETDASRPRPASALKSLADCGIDSVLVEGGAEVFSSFIAAGVWDDMHLLIAPGVFGPDGVGAADRRIDRGAVDAVVAGTRRLENDVWVGYLNAATRRKLVTRVTGA
jgi:diaminohydroxyphosphoribosylaminopyrimidine deaminase/5-amino-6-(5-phosphoribosylamino)uracil reductase